MRSGAVDGLQVYGANIGLLLFMAFRFALLGWCWRGRHLGTVCDAGTLFVGIKEILKE